MNKFIIIILILIGLIIINEVVRDIIRQRKRFKYFNLAKQRSLETGKPLIVVGDPYNGKGSRFWNHFMKPYGCGDVCVDLTGCPRCNNGVKSDLYNYLTTLPDDSAILFVSCVLEFVDNIEDVIQEIKRVTGYPSNLFVVTVDHHSLVAYLYKDGNHSSKSLIKAPPEYPDLSYKSLD